MRMISLGIHFRILALYSCAPPGKPCYSIPSIVPSLSFDDTFAYLCFSISLGSLHADILVITLLCFDFLWELIANFHDIEFSGLLYGDDRQRAAAFLYTCIFSRPSQLLFSAKHRFFAFDTACLISRSHFSLRAMLFICRIVSFRSARQSTVAISVDGDIYLRLFYATMMMMWDIITIFSHDIEHFARYLFIRRHYDTPDADIPSYSSRRIYHAFDDTTKYQPPNVTRLLTVTTLTGSPDGLPALRNIYMQYLFNISYILIFTFDSLLPLFTALANIGYVIASRKLSAKYHSAIQCNMLARPCFSWWMRTHFLDIL